MDDKSIVDLYWNRSETALSETASKYGGYCYHIAYNILANKEDAEESVSDTYLAAWNAMPPHRPSILATFLGKLTRRLSIDRWRARSAAKRGGGEVILALEELENCVSDTKDMASDYDRKELAGAYNAFLGTLPETERRVFLCRYWYLEPIDSIAAKFGFSRSKVTSMLHRTRGKLRTQIVKEGYL